MNVRILSLMLLSAWTALPVFAQHQHDSAAAAPAPQRARPANREWTRAPLILPAGRGERGTIMLRTQGLQASEIVVYAGDGPAERRRVAYPQNADGAAIRSAAPSVGNYHWVIAREESETELRVASTASYFSNPGDAPTRLLREVRHELEIIPEPLPREHSGYRESEKWRFLLRWRGAPLPQHPLHFESENGARISFLTDAAGYATVVFPRDHKSRKESAASHGRPPSAQFVLSAEREDGGKRYVTAFNLGYGPDADRDRSLAWGAGFGLLGMVAALPLLRRRSAKNGAGAQNA